MAVPILAILIDFIFMNINLSFYDLIALVLIVISIFVAATKPFNKKIGKI